MKRPGELITPATLGIVSHELRTPLAAIKGFTSTLLRYDGQLSAPERVELLREIDQAGDRLNQVVEHLLLLAELSSDTPQLTMQPIDMHLLVHDTVQQAEQPSHGDSLCSFNLDHTALSDGKSLFVSGDPHLLTFLLDELLENACKFSPQGSVITITLHVQSGQTATEASHVDLAGDSQLLISVHDTGIGIPAEDLERIFIPFVVMDDHLTRVTGGMGIGLALCRRIAQLHGGQLWAESHAGQGSTFYLLLPLA